MSWSVTAIYIVTNWIIDEKTTHDRKSTLSKYLRNQAKHFYLEVIRRIEKNMFQ